MAALEAAGYRGRYAVQAQPPGKEGGEKVLGAGNPAYIASITSCNPIEGLARD